MLNSSELVRVRMSVSQRQFMSKQTPRSRPHFAIPKVSASRRVTASPSVATARTTPPRAPDSRAVSRRQRHLARDDDGGDVVGALSEELLALAARRLDKLEQRREQR